jgi:hypothetical protein
MSVPAQEHDPLEGFGDIMSEFGTSGLHEGKIEPGTVANLNGDRLAPWELVNNRELELDVRQWRWS